MAITRSYWTDDDGTGKTGTIINNAELQTIYNNIDSLLPAWQAVPFSAAAFSAPSGSWTVAAGNIVTNRYGRVGSTVHWTLGVSGSTITGTPGSLKVTLPAGIVPASGMLGGSGWGFVGAAWQPLMVQIAAGQGWVDLYRQGIAGFEAGTTYVHFTLTFESQ